MKTISQAILISALSSVLLSCGENSCEPGPPIDIYKMLSDKYEQCLTRLGETPRPYPGEDPFLSECWDCYQDNIVHIDDCNAFVPCVDEYCPIPGDMPGILEDDDCS